jgi:UDP-glucose 4-epimerase
MGDTPAKTMRCLVLGGGGFLGSHVSEALTGSGYRVRIFEKALVDRGNVRDFFHRVEWIEGDFNSRNQLREVLDGTDYIVHCIGTTLPETSNKDPIYDISTNLLPTVHLLEAAKAVGVKKVIFLSSGGTVYGIPRSTPIPESHPTDPICSYGIQKLAIEKYLALYRHLHGLDYVVLRLANPYGARQKPEAVQGAIAVFMSKALRGETIEIWGDGSVVRDYLYVTDIACAVLSALRYEGEYRVFNIGSGIGFSILDLVARIEKIVGRTVHVHHKPGRRFDIPINVLDISRADRELGWRPQVEFDDGLQMTKAYLSQGV